MALFLFQPFSLMIHLNAPPPNSFERRTELDALLPILLERANPRLQQQLQQYGFMQEDIEAACYKLYDAHGIDPLLQVHPLRESFFQLELSEGNFQDFISGTIEPVPVQKQKKQRLKKTGDYIKINKDGLLLFVAIALGVLLLLQLLPKP